MTFAPNSTTRIITPQQQQTRKLSEIGVEQKRKMSMVQQINMECLVLDEEICSGEENEETNTIDFDDDDDDDIIVEKENYSAIDDEM